MFVQDVTHYNLCTMATKASILGKKTLKKQLRQIHLRTHLLQAKTIALYSLG